jgi:transcription elongation GreA/GreB family factor
VRAADRRQIIAAIIARLEADLALFTATARHAHAAATHEECQPDNKYAQGQANRALEIRQSLEAYRGLELRESDADGPVRLGALVTLEDDAGRERRLFIGPREGGMKLVGPEGEIVVITPASPLGKQLLGLVAGDELRMTGAGSGGGYTVVHVC